MFSALVMPLLTCKPRVILILNKENIRELMCVLACFLQTYFMSYYFATDKYMKLRIFRDNPTLPPSC